MFPVPHAPLGRPPSHGHRIGGKASPTYLSWVAMLERCRREKHPMFSRYGGRGITVCGRWSSFENFLADMGARPPGMTLDRIDNDGNYEPGNCRWATPFQQHNNTVSNHVLEVKGESLTISEWARRSGLHKATIRARLVSGWTAERAVLTPLNATRSHRGRP